MERRISKMKKYFKLLLPIFLISLLVFLAGCVPSAPTPPVSTKATIEGRIMVPGSSTKDISGWVPLPNAVITLTDSEGKVHTVTTDSDGYYTLFDIPPGINYIITATGKVGENTVILKDIIPKVETGKNYDAGTADSESTALALVVEALLAKGLTPEEIDLEEIKNTDNFPGLVSQVTSALEENGDVTNDPVIKNQVEEIVEEIVSPETPEPEPSSGGGGGGGGGAPPPTISGSLCGTVISDAGGPAVEGSTVIVVGTILSTTTDAGGNYAIDKVPVGTYDVVVSQEGRATSKVQNVRIIGGQTTVVNLIQKEVNVPTTWETDPPTISTTGIADGDILTGVVTCSAQVVDDSDIKYIFVGFGYIPGELEYDFAIYGSKEIALGPIDTTTIPNGEFQIVIVAYDMNYNRSQLTLNVTINNEGLGDAPGVPVSLWPLSVTLGEKVGYFSTGRDELFKRIGIKENPNIINLPEGREIDLNAVINVAGPDSNLFVVIDWEGVEDATGYKIYRKFEGEATYHCIGSTGYSLFYDTDPQLSVGRKTYYQVSAYNGFGESEKTTAEWTIPLPKFNLNLVSPQNDATGVSITPTLQWQPVEVVGKYQDYYFYIMGKNDSYYTWGGEVENETSVVYNGEPLQYIKVYEWDVWYAIAFDDFYSTFPEFQAVSIAGNYDIIWGTGGGSLNGAFEFTTKSE